MDDKTFNNNQNKKTKRLNIDKKYFYFAIMGLFLIVGVSYAFIFFRERFEGNNLGLINELLDVKISENGVVSMNNATGQKDEEGIENERTTFNIINNNKVPIRVVIKLVEDNNSNMDINQVRFGILVSGKIMNVGNLGENDGVLLDFQMNPGQDATLESTIWLDYFYNGGTNTEIFSGKYVVEASNVDDYGYMYLKNLVGKNKGLVAINTDGELAQEGDEIREYRYSGSAKYCTYTVDGEDYRLEVDGDTCPNACYDGTFLYRYDNEWLSVEGNTCDSEVNPNQTTPLDGEVDNYIWFNNEMWRIIGVFNETTGNGKSQELIKIVRDEPLLQDEVPIIYTYNNVSMEIKDTSDVKFTNLKYAPVHFNKSKYFGQTNGNDWSNSALQYYLNDETEGASSYYNTIDSTYQKMIETVEYNLGNVNYDTLASEVYNAERSGKIHAGNRAMWVGKIGMIYTSDYGYASSNEAWNSIMCNYGRINFASSLNNWFHDNVVRFEWTMSSSTLSASKVNFIDTFGNLNYNDVTSRGGVSPVLYLKSDVLITAGNGSEEKPYQVERPELVRIPTKATNTIKSKVGTDGLVAINTNGELASKNDEIREYRYSGSSKYCTYTIDGNTYQLEVDGDTCPSACNLYGYALYRYDNDYLTSGYGTCPSEVKPNQTSPVDGKVDNYIRFNDEMWRIIGVFKVITEAGTQEELVKIIRDEQLMDMEVPQYYAYNGISMEIKDTNYLGMKYKTLRWNYSKYFNQVNNNDWTSAALRFYLNDETKGANSYYNSIDETYREMIETVQYNLGNVDSTTTIGAYENEKSENIHSGNVAKWLGKIGLMYPSDYGYGAPSLAWKTLLSTYGKIENSITLTNWFNDNVSFVKSTISPSVRDGDGIITFTVDGMLGVNSAQNPMVVSPVLYLKSDVLITAGNGSEEDPYIVERYEMKKKPTKVVDEIKSKVGTDGLVAINTNGELADDNDKIREYRYSGSARYCTYTVDGSTYQLEVDSDTCPNAVDSGDYIYTCKETASNCDVTPNQITPIDGEVDNYVWYNDEMWRIIGVFTETKSDGTEEELVKIIRELPLTNAEVPETYTYNGTKMAVKDTSGNYANYKYAYIYWNYNKYFGQANFNDWTKAVTQYYLNDETTGASSYCNSIVSTYQSMIETVQYDISNVEYGAPVSDAYTQERSGNVWEGNQATWTGKIGMMYLSDYGYAAESGAWSVATSLYGSKTQPATLSNWMNDNVRGYEWIMSPSSNNAFSAMIVDSDGRVSSNAVDYFIPLSPVLYLKNGVLVTDGDGSYNNPYKLG